MKHTMHSQSVDKSCPASKSYSSFWALVVLFVTLGFLQTTSLISDFSNRDKIQTARDQIKKALVQAQNINLTTEAVSRDLILLSAKSPEAAKIVAEFKIK